MALPYRIATVSGTTDELSPDVKQDLRAGTMKAKPSGAPRLKLPLGSPRRAFGRPPAPRSSFRLR